MTGYHSELRKRVRYLAEHFGQAELARRTGTSPSTLSRYLRSTRIPAEFVARATTALELRPDWILSGSEPPFASSVSEQTANMADSLLEIVRGIQATSHMRAAAVFGQSNPRMLNNLNEALRNLKQLRAEIREKFEPKFHALVDAVSKALQRFDMEGAERLLSSAEMFAELCPDQDIIGLLNSCKAQFLGRTGRSEEALPVHTKLLNWACVEWGLEETNTFTTAINHVTLLIRLERRTDALRLCQGFRHFAESLGDTHPVPVYLGAFAAYLQIRTGNIRAGLGPFLAANNRLKGTNLHGPYGALHLSVLYLSGAANIAQAWGLVLPSVSRCLRALTLPMSMEDRANLSEALKLAVGPDELQISPRDPLAKAAAALVKRLEGGSPAHFRKAVLDDTGLLQHLQTKMSRYHFQASLAAFQRLAGLREVSLKTTKELSKRMQLDRPGQVPDVLTEAQHLRNLLLASRRTNSAECRTARQRLAALRAQGYRCLDAWEPDGLG